eukprot:gene5017-10041_t
MAERDIEAACDNTPEIVRFALSQSGAGSISCYDSGSFTTAGIGRFRALEGANPHVGDIGKVCEVEEDRIETEFLSLNGAKVIKALVDAHPYEAPAIHIVPIIDYRSFLKTNIQLESIPNPHNIISIAIEALDTSLRETVCGLLATQLQATILQALPNSLATCKEFIEHENRDVRQGYSIAGCVMTGHEMCKLIDSGTSVVLNGYYVSLVLHSQGSSSSSSSNSQCDSSFSSTWPCGVPRPDFMVVLCSSSNNDNDYYKNTGEVYRRMGCVEINADGSPQDIVLRIMAYLATHRPSHKVSQT